MSAVGKALRDFVGTISGRQGAEAASDASAALQEASLQSGQIFRDQAEVNNQLLEPVVEGGLNAFDQQQSALGLNGVEAQQDIFNNFVESPGVSFARRAGEDAVVSRFAGNGQGGGSRLKAISEFNQGLALQDFSNQQNQIGQVATQGQQNAFALSNIQQQNAQLQGDTILQGAGAQARGQIAAANSQQQGSQNIANIIGRFFGSS